jgi:hypothetical protein
MLVFVGHQALEECHFKIRQELPLGCYRQKSFEQLQALLGVHFLK